MVETDDDTYKLNADGRNQTLRVSLINNEQISLILTNVNSNQNFTALITLEQFVEVCEAFKSAKNAKEGLQIIKDTIEAGNIMIEEDPQEKNAMEIKFNVIIEDKEYPGFNIRLDLQNENANEQNQQNEENDEDVEVLPPTFDYQGNQEAETRYGNNQENTTENLRDIVQSDVKPPILQLEYIEPILQVHYPDGTTKSHALPPRIQSVDGQTPNITEEQLKSIQEQMNKNSTITNFSPLKDFLNNNRSSSVAKKHVSAYSTQSTPYPGSNNLTRVNPFENNDDVNIYQKQNYTQVNQIPNNYQYFNEQNMQTDYTNYNKISSGYSSMTIQSRPFGAPGMQYLPNPLLANLNNTNIYQNNNFYQGNNIIEQRPRMLQKNPNSKYSSKTNHPRDRVRSQSLPSQDNYKFNRKTNANRKHSKNYPYQEEKQNNHKEKYPYDRNTERHPKRNKDANIKQGRKSNVERLKENLPKNSLSHIQRQQQRLLEVQQKLAEIQRQQKELQERQKEILLKQKNQRLANLNRQQIRIMPDEKIRKAQSQAINKELQFQKRFPSNEIKNPPPASQQPPREQQIKQTNSLTNNNNTQVLQHKTSKEIRQAKTQMINPNSKFRTQTSQPIPSQTPSLANNDISQKLINLAQMASMQNQANPNLRNIQAIALEQQHEVINQEEQEEVQEYQPQVEQEQVQAQEQQYEEVQNEAEAQEEAAAEQEQGGVDPSIEQLFFTEDGRVIFRNGLLRGIIHKYAEIDDVVSKIQDILAKGVKFTLVYKAFDIGDSAKDFHAKCDPLDMSLVLIETDKDIRFGGFTTQSWAGANQKKKDNNAFVFSLETNKIFEIFPDEPAIGCYPKFGPVFFGCQIRIYDQFFSKGGTTCHKGLNYNTDEDYELNNGEQKYLIKDIEIYKIDTIDI